MVVEPVRTCVGCRQRHEISVLMRVQAGLDGQLTWDESGRGRGVWLCRASPECVRRACRTQALGRGLRVSVAPESLIGFARAMGVELS